MSIPTFFISGYGYDNCKEKQYFSKNDYQKQETVPTILGGYLINFFYSLFWLLRNFRDRKNLIEIEGRNSYSSESTDYKERFGGHGRTTGLNVSTNPLWQWRFFKCLTFGWTTLRDKYCWHPIAVMQSYAPPWTILWFRILGIFSVENIVRMGVFYVSNLRQ